VSIGRQLSVVGFMLALAALDFAGALVAQDLADRRRMSSLLLGSALSITLFVVYAVALRLADLSIVTMGWIVMLQVAVIASDVVRHGLHLNPLQWTAITLIIVLQIFLTATTQRRADPPRTSAAYEMPCRGGGQTSTGVVAPGRSPVTR
jgi:drug/metabolite transporter (DMT)-like permease